MDIPVSLVIPVRDEEASIDALLATIAAQTYPPAEVIFVDGGSTDHTVERLRIAGESDSRMRVLAAGPATPGRGRNVGISAAANSWIALTDAGIQLEPDWLERLVAVIRADPEVDVVHGSFEPVTRTFFQHCVALCTIAPKHDTPSGRASPKFIASTMLRKRVWQSVGGFPDQRAGEDLTFMESTVRDGFKIGWAPDARVWWQMQPNLSRTFRRFQNYSYHNVLAGRQWDWHYGIARMYVVIVPFLIFGFVNSLWWLCVPLVGACLRILMTIWSRREGRGWAWAINPYRFLGVFAALVVLDAAMYAGWIQATLRRLRSWMIARRERRR